MHAPDIVQYQNNRQFFCLAKLLRGFTGQLTHPKFPHRTKIQLAAQWLLNPIPPGF
jgi:hypothetical protein